MSESAGMATPGVMLAQLFKSIMCFVRVFHMKGALAVLANKVFGVLLAFWSILGISDCLIMGAGFT